VAFDVSPAPRGELLSWRMVLPADERLAHERLRAAAAQLRTVDAALRQCEKRMANVAAAGGQGSGMSFGVTGSGFALPAAEQELLHELDAFQRSHQPIAFGLAGDMAARLGQGWQQMAASCQTFMDRVASFTSHDAWVETQVGQELIGRTVLDWGGDMRTLWRPSAEEKHVALHENALSLALGSRQQLMQALVTVSRGAVLLASLPAMLATPLGAVVALPAAWRFVSRVISLLDLPG
jgi:hypothetical protein